jgi:hypothetical protein
MTKEITHAPKRCRPNEALRALTKDSLVPLKERGR